MEDLLRQLVAQNQQILEAINTVASRLESLERIEELLSDRSEVHGLESSVLSMGAHLGEIADALDWTNESSAVGMLLTEITWHKGNSTAQQLLNAVQAVEAAVLDSAR